MISGSVAPSPPPQVELSGIRPVNDKDRREGFNEIEYVDRFRRDPEACFGALRKLAEEGIQDAPFRTLVLKLLDFHQPKLMLLRVEVLLLRSALTTTDEAHHLCRPRIRGLRYRWTNFTALCAGWVLHQLYQRK